MFNKIIFKSFHKTFLFKFIITLLFSFSFSLSSSFSQDDPGYKIEIQIEDYPGDTVFLGFRRGEKIYSKDTVAINANGKFILQGEEELKPGNYLVPVSYTHLTLPTTPYV